MKAYEEDWDNGRDFEVTVSGPELDRGIDAPRETLARYAPNMARWMLSQGEPLCKGGEWHLKTCGGACDPECTEYRVALKKAGVLP